MTAQVTKQEIDALLADQRAVDMLGGALEVAEGGRDLLYILGQYIAFNAVFSSCITGLAAATARQDGLFRDAAARRCRRSLRSVEDWRPKYEERCSHFAYPAFCPSAVCFFALSHGASWGALR
jgi:hypothetical protein